jgi:copper(I)-binding protein
MKTLKLSMLGGSIAALAVVSVLAVQAASPLTVSCAGAVAGNQVTWTATSTGGNAPIALFWSGNTQVAGNTSTALVRTYPANGTFVSFVQATDASSSIATTTCSVLVTANAPAPTSTVPMHIQKPALMINPNGEFNGRGMTVTSVASGSLQANVWGITYTVNFTGNALNFFYQTLSASSTTNPASQIKVGDEVSVTGKIASSSPFIVSAKSLRDLSIISPRMDKHDNGKDNDKESNDDNGSSTASSSAHVDFNGRVKLFFSQLQGFFGKGRGK